MLKRCQNPCKKILPNFKNGKMQTEIIQTTEDQEGGIVVLDGNLRTLNLAVNQHFRINFEEKQLLLALDDE
jgi:hypothetical protein